MSLVDIIRSKDLYDYIPDLIMQQDGTYRKKCELHGGTNVSSFTVFPDTNTYHCWSCQSSGDIITYTMERDGCDFDVALQTICDFYNIDITKDTTYVKQKSIAEKNEIVCKKYEKSIPVIYEYLKKRGFDDSIIKLYRFGWSDKAQALTIPLINKYNQVISFSYRFFDKKPKYKHGYANDLFNKSTYWFNLINAMKLVKKNNKIFLVEGHIDSASLQMQHEAAIAYLGIVLSKDQLLNLKKTLGHLKSIEVILIPDQDGRAVTHIPKVRQMFQTWWPECNLRVALMNDFGSDIKDANDMLKAGLQISDVKTQHIDVFTCSYLMTTCSNIEQEYSEALKFIRTVKSELIKVDIARLLSKRWEQDIEDVKKHLSVSIDSKEELLRDHHDIMSCMEDWEDLCESEGKGIGWPEIDDTLDGLRKKEIVVLSGYTSAGKSTLVLKTIAHRIIRYGDNVLMFSFEMPRGAVIESLLCEIIGINQFELKKWRKDERNVDIYTKVMEIIGSHLIVIDKSGINMKDVWKHTELANEYDFNSPVNYAVIDHFHLFPGVEENPIAAREANLIQDYVKHFNLTCIVLAQFKEASQGLTKSGKFIEPSVTSIKGSNALKAIAGTILLAWRVYYSRLDLPEIEREEQKFITKIKVGKHRRGVKNGIYFSLEYDPKTTRMAVK